MSRVLPARLAGRPGWQLLGLAVVMSIALHAIGAAVFRVQIETKRPPALKSPLVTFLSPTATAPSIDEFRKLVALADPSASSLPSLHGFSSTTLERPVTVPSLIEPRREDPQLLARPQINPTQLTIVAEAPLPRLLAAHAEKEEAEPDAELEITGPIERVHRTESTFLMGGSLKERRLLSLVSFPQVHSPAPAQPTVVRVAVSPIGAVRFAIIDQSCGADDKDARALDIIRRWRFEALSGEAGDQWGTVSVYWAAETPAPANAETNQPPAESPAP